jgi:Ca2+-binding EF-hand superfamily protein
MKIKLFTVFAVLAGLAMASGTPEKEEGRKDRGKPGIKQWIEKFDKNGDGKLDEAERKAAGAARKAEFLKKFDKDGDGKISAEERKAIAEAMKNRRGRPEGRKPGTRKPKPEGRKPGKKPGKKPEGRKPGKKPAKKK